MRPAIRRHDNADLWLPRFFTRFNCRRDDPHLIYLTAVLKIELCFDGPSVRGNWCFDVGRGPTGFEKIVANKFSATRLRRRGWNIKIHHYRATRHTHRFAQRLAHQPLRQVFEYVPEQNDFKTLIDERQLTGISDSNANLWRELMRDACHCFSDVNSRPGETWF